MIRVAVDIVIFSIRDRALQALLIKRGVPPFRGRWAIPGGFVRGRESLDEAARRELREETGISNVFLEQLYSFGDADRDPRGRVVSVAYYALVSPGLAIAAGTDAVEARWFRLDRLPSPAFDHPKILRTALQRLRGKLDYTTVGFELLPRTFTLTELQRVHEAILARRLDKRNFRRRIDMLKLVRPLRQTRREGLPRPARLYRFAHA